MSASEAAARTEAAVSRLAGMLFTYTSRPTVKARRAIHDAALNDDVMQAVDTIVERLARVQPSARRLHRLGRALATKSTDPGPVRLGIALLRLFHVRRDRSLLVTLGRREEFASDCATALAAWDEPAWPGDAIEPRAQRRRTRADELFAEVDPIALPAGT